MNKLTYEQRVQKISKLHADKYNQGGRREYAGGPLLKNEPEHMREEAELTIAAQAEAIREALVYCLDSDTHMIDTEIDNYLKRNGYVQ